MNWLPFTRLLVLTLVAGCSLPESSASAQKSTTASKTTAAGSAKGNDSKGNDSKSSAAKATETKPAESKAESKASDTKASDTKVSGSKATESKANESKATDSKATDSKAGEKSTETKKSDSSNKSSSVSPEDDKKIKSMLRSTMKSFSAAELTAEQTQKADELLPKAIKDFVVKRAAAGITDEMVKKHTAAQKEAKASGKSVKEQTAIAFEAAGLSEDQLKIFKSTQSALTKAKRDVAKTLSDEQIAKLPEQLKTVVQTGKR